MNPKELISRIDEQLVTRAIAEAESRTSGEIRVYISHKPRHDALEFAKRRFVELGMTKTRERNGVLIYIVPRTQQFAVLGDSGIHQRCGDGFWKQITSAMADRMKRGEFTEALVHAIGEIGAVLAKHFPRADDDRNELSNEIARDSE